MASAYGEMHGLVCEVCGLRYDSFRVMTSFAKGKTQKIAEEKRGTRGTVLGWMYGEKQREWKLHVETCNAAMREALNNDDANRIADAATEAREKYEADELAILRARRAEAGLRHKAKLKALGLKKIGVGRNARKHGKYARGTGEADRGGSHRGAPRNR